jgi:hypothetical protein
MLSIGGGGWTGWYQERQKLITNKAIHICSMRCSQSDEGVLEDVEGELLGAAEDLKTILLVGLEG